MRAYVREVETRQGGAHQTAPGDWVADGIAKSLQPSHRIFPEMADDEKERHFNEGLNAMTAQDIARYKPANYKEVMEAVASIMQWEQPTAPERLSAPDRRRGRILCGRSSGWRPKSGGGRGSCDRVPPFEVRSQRTSVTRCKWPRHGGVGLDGMLLCSICHTPRCIAGNCPDMACDAPPQAPPTGVIIAVSGHAQGRVPVRGAVVEGEPARVIFDAGADINVISQAWLDKPGHRTTDAAVSAGRCALSKSRWSAFQAAAMPHRTLSP